MRTMAKRRIGSKYKQKMRLRCTMQGLVCTCDASLYVSLQRCRDRLCFHVKAKPLKFTVIVCQKSYGQVYMHYGHNNYNVR